VEKEYEKINHGGGVGTKFIVGSSYLIIYTIINVAD
jgi:hypothetical protein